MTTALRARRDEIISRVAATTRSWVRRPRPPLKMGLLRVGLQAAPYYDYQLSVYETIL